MPQEELLERRRVRFMFISLGPSESSDKFSEIALFCSLDVSASKLILYLKSKLNKPTEGISEICMFFICKNCVSVLITAYAYCLW